MPVRSSVCTYSPSASSNSKYSSSVLPTSSSLSIGHYKQLSSNTVGTYKPSTSSYGKSSPSSVLSGTSSGIGSSTSRYSLSSSSYSPSSLSSSSYSSLNSGSSFTSSGHYRPLGSANHSFSSSRFNNNTPSPTSTYSRFSSASSTGSTSSSSLSSASCYFDKSDSSSSGHPSISNYNYQSSALNRRLSYTSQPETPLPPGVPCGLTNLGNTCYMNATIQSLYSVDSFRDLILRGRQDKPLTSEISDLFKRMKTSSTPISPTNLKHAFSRYQSKFSGYGQQDAQEFLRYLINGLHEEWNLASKRPRRSTAPKPPTTAEEAWNQYRDIVDDSPLVDVVVGQLCSTIVCSMCQNKSFCWDPFWDLSLPLVSGRHRCKLSDVISDFTAKETLDSDERPICSNCKKATRSSKQISFYRVPKLIILHLKKCTNDGYKMTSPEVEIDDTLTFNNTTYTLTACISHHGHSSSSGHYTSHCKYSSRWFHFNDERVKECQASKFTEAYVLFYTLSTSSSLSKL